MPASGIDALANYGLGGLIFVTMVVPLALYVLRDKDRQLAHRDEELNRLRAELVDLRRALDPIAPALTEMSRTMTVAITLLERARQ